MGVEIFIDVFIAMLLEKLASADLIRLAGSAGIDSQLDNLKNILSQFQALVADAERKNIRFEAFHKWLDKLRPLAYDVDDLLDDLATDAMRRQLEDGHTTNSKVWKMVTPSFGFCTPHTIMYDHKTSSKLHEITTKLGNLFVERNILGLDDDVPRPNVTIRKRYIETSLIPDWRSEIVGLEEDKSTLLWNLLSNKSGNQNYDVVSIVGMGGSGKTTLARDLYGEVKVKDHFQLRVWVCVSDAFDVFGISKDIFRSVGGEDEGFANLNMIQVALAAKLSNKKFLVVLDDVWNENYDQWRLLQYPFLVGAPGSKIMVTTRNKTVALMMNSIVIYDMNHFSDEKALTLLAIHALGELNFDSHPALKLHAEGIVKKCGGLPLALRTIGTILRTSTYEEDWKEFLNREMWDSRVEDNTLRVLRLSYDGLPPHLKLMFAYCSLFPEDYVFDKDELILLWMAEGLLYQSNDIKSMEIFGHECFDELLARSFFQHSSYDKSGYIVHDLMHEIAMAVAREFFFKLYDERNPLTSEALDKVHHFSFICQPFEVYGKFKALLRARHLRTLLAVPASLDAQRRFILSNNDLVRLLSQLQLLRVLNLSNYSFTEIPQSIGGLKHMRYINFSGTDITFLPEQVGDLFHLQSLMLRSCQKLVSLPNSLGRLINLRHLDITDTPRLSKMPPWIGGLTSLQISRVIIGGANGFEISDLQGLSHLHGQLSIEGLHNVTDKVQAREANLQQKKGLHDLEMKWIDDFDDSRKENIEFEVLEELRPHDELRNLKIMFYGGKEFPSWVGNSSFVCLTQLTLRGCRSCSHLPALGHLSSLQKLFVESMNGVKNLGSELLRCTNSYHDNAFPALEVLKFKDLQGWEKWSVDDDENGGTTASFPRLHEISILNCPKLSLVSVDRMPSLQVLHIQRCSKVVLRSMIGASTSIVRLTIENIKGLTQLHGEVLEYLGTVEHLFIKQCDELEYLWKSESEACKILMSLLKLEVHSCRRLVSLGETEGNMGISLKSVTHVYVSDCKTLQCFNCPNNIESLMILNCPSIKSLTFSTLKKLPYTLNILDIRRCDNLGASWLLDDFLSSLDYLEIGRLPNLRSFPERCFVDLTRLVMRGCDNIESFPKNVFGLHLRSLEIISCTSLKSFPHTQLTSLTNLETLWISNCPSMDSFPCELWPPKLKNLTIGGLKKSMSKWGTESLPTSLETLYLHGENSGAVPFAGSKDANNSTSIRLPSSLTYLEINGFKDLKSVSESLQHLTNLKGLVIDSCPKLRDLPENLLPKLSILKVFYSPNLQERCHRRKGNYRGIISQIPELYV